MSGADDHATNGAGTTTNPTDTPADQLVGDGEMTLENMGMARGPLSAGQLHQAVSDVHPDATVYVPAYEYPARITNAFVVTPEVVFPIGLVEFHGVGPSTWTKYPPVDRDEDPEVEEHVGMLAEYDAWIALDVDDEVKGRARYILDEFWRSPFTSDLMFALIILGWVGTVAAAVWTSPDRLAVATQAVSATLVGYVIAQRWYTGV